MVESSSAAVSVVPGEMAVTRVPTEYVDSCWQAASVFLKKGVEFSRGRYDIEAVYEDIMRGTQHLWVVFLGDDEMIAALTTQFAYYPRKMNLSIVFCGSNEMMGGTSGNWIKVVEIVMDWSRAFGCSGIEVIGRRGWSRVLSPMGFEESYTTIEMEI